MRAITATFILSFLFFLEIPSYRCGAQRIIQYTYDAIGENGRTFQSSLSLQFQILTIKWFKMQMKRNKQMPLHRTRKQRKYENWCVAMTEVSRKQTEKKTHSVAHQIFLFLIAWKRL